MATFTHGSNADVWIMDSGSTEREISSAIISVSLPLQADTAETTALGDTDKTYIAGLKDKTVSFDGSRDPTIEGYLEGVIGLARRVRYFPEGSASGKIYYDGTAIFTSLTTSSDVGDANRFSCEAQGTNAFTRRTV